MIKIISFTGISKFYEELETMSHLLGLFDAQKTFIIKQMGCAYGS